MDGYGSVVYARYREEVMIKELGMKEAEERTLERESSLTLHRLACWLRHGDPA